MQPFLFVPTVVAVSTQAATVRKALAIALLALAAFVIGYGLVVFVQAWRTLSHLPTAAVLGGVLFEAALIIAIYAVVHIAVLRARELELLPRRASPVLSVAPTVVRALSEMYAAFVAFVAVGGGLFVWFSARSVGAVLRPMPPLFPAVGDASFLGGILLIFAGLAAAVATLFIGYLLAELLERVAERARPE